jgi:hypothetical protein
VHRENPADERNRVDVEPRPAGDAQHFVDREPGHVAAPALLAPQPFFLNGGDEPVVLERGRGGIVRPRLERQDPHARSIPVMIYRRFPAAPA